MALDDRSSLDISGRLALRDNHGMIGSLNDNLLWCSLQTSCCRVRPTDFPHVSIRCGMNMRVGSFCIGSSAIAHEIRPGGFSGGSRRFAGNSVFVHVVGVTPAAAGAGGVGTTSIRVIVRGPSFATPAG
jgi:hypothetical protein